jgi:broad specificity phosphatase PhoE
MRSGAYGVALYRQSAKLPARLWVVRHGESAGNVARDVALRSGANRIDIQDRDVDVPLSALGEQQSEALAHWFARLPQKAEVVLSSPYRRALETAGRIVDASALAEQFDRVAIDERLREKEFGILDRLTRSGIEQAYPDIAAYRTLLGKFYHRPPGGESWCDVILRLRSMLDTLSLHHSGKRVVIVTHQVVVLCLRYLIEGLDEAEILAIDRRGDVANCAVTEYVCENGSGLVLQRYNHVTPLIVEGAPLTTEADRKAAGA